MYDKNRNLLLALVLPALVVAAACGDDDDDVVPPPPTPMPTPDAGVMMPDGGTPDGGTPDGGTGAGNIVEVAQENGLNQLIATASTAGLADTLAQGGPFTVFAPTDMAFMNLGAAAPSDPGLLANVLLNHVVMGELDSTAVTSTSSLMTLANTSIAVDASATPPTVGGAALSSTLDVEASNGIVHVLDEVIVPPDILAAAMATPATSTLAAAVGAASQSVRDALSGDGPITVFAPVNSAFAGIDLGMLTQAQIDEILTYHVVPQQVLSMQLTDGSTLATAQGGTLTANVSGGTVTLTDAQGGTVEVLTPDIRLLNGTIHLIDGVLRP